MNENKQIFYYNKLSDYYKNTFGSKVFKVSLNAGFTCPNRDGSLGYGGCIFCSDSGSGDFAGNPLDDLKTQFERIKEMMHKKWNDGKYIVYFQANTNTYGPTSQLIEMYEYALSLDPDIIGISISTRPDCINEELYPYLEELSKITYVTIELGLQTIHQKTSDFINRGHDLTVFDETLDKLRARGINVVVHIINGLPNETQDDMMETIEYLSKKDIQGIKIHLLHIMKYTQLGNLYMNEPFPLMSLNEYVNLVVDQLERVPKHVVIHRLTGDAPRDTLIEPKWSLKKFVVLNEIDKEFKRRGSYQGRLCK